MLLGSLYSPEGGWLKRVAGTLFQGITEGTLNAPSFAPATGYIAFFTLTIYVGGLVLLAFADNSPSIGTNSVVEESRQLPVAERLERMELTK
jgi:hypothetical protein